MPDQRTAQGGGQASRSPAAAAGRTLQTPNKKAFCICAVGAAAAARGRAPAVTWFGHGRMNDMGPIAETFWEVLAELPPRRGKDERGHTVRLLRWR